MCHEIHSFRMDQNRTYQLDICYLDYDLNLRFLWNLVQWNELIFILTLRLAAYM